VIQINQFWRRSRQKGVKKGKDVRSVKNRLSGSRGKGRRRHIRGSNKKEKANEGGKKIKGGGQQLKTNEKKNIKRQECFPIVMKYLTDFPINDPER